MRNYVNYICMILLYEQPNSLSELKIYEGRDKSSNKKLFLQNSNINVFDILIRFYKTILHYKMKNSRKFKERFDHLWILILLLQDSGWGL